MRIIKDGVEMQVTCRECNSVLGIAPEDVHDCSGHGTCVICPVCRKRIDLQIKDMPYLFKNRVNWDE